MLHKPTKVTLAANAFKRMGNLKFLIVHNVHICNELKYLPNGLRFLDLPNYPFPLPSNFCPQKLATLNMPCSHKCESITKLPNLCTPNLENLDLSFCKNLVECHESIGFLDKLQKLCLFSCKKLQNPKPSHVEISRHFGYFILLKS